MVEVQELLPTNLAMRFQVVSMHVGSEDNPLVARQDRSSPVRLKIADALRSIRDEMGLTNKSFATRLGIGPSTLSSYLYGRVTQIPESLLQHARAIADNTARDRVNPRARFLAEATMVQIVEDWVQKLGGEPPLGQDVSKSSAQDLANLLGVHKTTLWRWQQPEAGAKSMRPTLERIRRYDAEVLRAVAAKSAP